MNKNGGAGSTTGMDILSQVQRKSWLHAPDETDDPTFGDVGQRSDNIEQDGRVKVLEEELHEKTVAIEKLTHENEKLKKVVQDFKDKWSKLAERAKKRDRNKTAAGGSVESKSTLNKVEENGE